MAGLVHKKEPEGSYQEGCRWRLHHYTGCLTASGLKCPFQLSWKCQLWASISSRQYSSDTASVIPLSDLQRGEKKSALLSGEITHSHTQSWRRVHSHKSGSGQPETFRECMDWWSSLYNGSSRYCNSNKNCQASV